jgi:hypothetical protein
VTVDAVGARLVTDVGAGATVVVVVVVAVRCDDGRRLTVVDVVRAGEVPVGDGTAPIAETESVTVTKVAGLGAERLPAMSVSVEVTLHFPCSSVSNVHAVSGRVYEHDTDTPPFDAVIVTNSPVVPTRPEISGVESLVVLSVDESPVSEGASMSGAGGEGGVLVSMVSARAGLTEPRTPPGPVRNTVTLHTPPARAGIVHELSTPTTYVQVRLRLPRVAVIVATSPTFPPTAERLGVVSAVTLSTLDAPVSEAATRSGIAVVPMMLIAVAALGADTLPAGSARVAVTVHVPDDKVGMVHDVDVPIT